MSPQDYFALVVDFLERLSTHIAIQRISSEVPVLKLAPVCNMRRHELLPHVEALLLARDTWQGRLSGAARTNLTIEFIAPCE